MNDYESLYKIIYELTTVFESSKAPVELVLGLKQVFKNFCMVNDLNIYIFENGTNTFKNFIKPWEELQDNEEKDELLSQYNEFLKGKTYIKTQNTVFFPLFKKGKINGILKLACTIKDDMLEKISPILSRQISLSIAHLEYFEGAKNNAKFYETVKNIMKITETQYDLNYILPIMGEIIDGFISKHLIYVFLKKSGKKEFKLIWPNKCLISNIEEYLCELKDNNYLIKENGRTCIFPLIENKKVTGAIVAYNPLDNLKEWEIKYLEQLTIQVSITTSKAKEYMQVLENATLDALTGLNNRHMFYQRLNETIANAKRQKTNLCCIMTDIDFFKSVNDTYGHAVGDLVLKTAAKTIKKELRPYDIASRYGGEEFAILLPNTSINEAYKVAQRLRNKIEKKKINIEEFKIEGKAEISVTISVGVAQYTEDMKEVNKLYELADKGLYEAKETGRNKVIISK